MELETFFLIRGPSSLNKNNSSTTDSTNRSCEWFRGVRSICCGFSDSPMLFSGPCRSLSMTWRSQPQYFALRGSSQCCVMQACQRRLAAYLCFRQHVPQRSNDVIHFANLHPVWPGMVIAKLHPRASGALVSNPDFPYCLSSRAPKWRGAGILRTSPRAPRSTNNDG